MTFVSMNQCRVAFYKYRFFSAFTPYQGQSFDLRIKVHSNSAHVPHRSLYCSLLTPPYIIRKFGMMFKR